MDGHALELTRRSLHAVAEYLLAGPQWEASRDIRLRAVPGGFATVAQPDVRVVGAALVAGGQEHPLRGTVADVAALAGLTPRDLREVYADGPTLRMDEPLHVDPAAAEALAEAFGRADTALRAFAPAETPVLWPEHFDIGVTVAEVNYGVSPGDRHVPEPYGYVGPWQPRLGEFWSMPFGAVVLMSSLPDADALTAFFHRGAEHAEKDPKAS